MNSSRTKARQSAYVQILHRALLAIRSAALAGKVKLCEIEADHVHNIPSLLNEQDETRHSYYVDCERDLYINRLRQLVDKECFDSRMQYYEEPWKILMAIDKRVGDNSKS